MLSKTIILALAGAALAAPSIDKRAVSFNDKLNEKLAKREPTGKQLVKRAGGSITDTQILQYALTLEHLESTFYNQYLGQYDAAAFTAAGYPDWVRPRFEMIASDEATHVQFLTGALGNDAVAVCDYKFPVNSIADFTTVAQALEIVGVAAYLGAAANITDPTYLTYAGSILVVEAQHEAWESADVLFESAFPYPFATPLGFSEVYSIASAFITNSDCSANANLPVKAFPALAVSGTPTLGGSITVTPASTANIPSSGVYAVFIQGPLAPYATTYNSGSPITIPSNVTDGFSFLVLSTSMTPTDDTILAGPALINIPSYIQ